MKKITSVECGDWHLGWGLGGHNKIGELRVEGDVFTWQGRCQGRHGQKGRTYTVQFKLTGWYGEEPYVWNHDQIEYIGDERGLPAFSELRPAIDKLIKTE